MAHRLRLDLAAVAVALTACGGSTREAGRPTPAPAPAPLASTPAPVPDPDLDRPAPRKLLAIDWTSITLASDADALALWQRIAPTGEDWEAKLEEIPDEGELASKLALALLREGNFTCAPPPPTGACARPAIDIDPPPHGATLADPCLRRMLALWAIGTVEGPELAVAHDALRAIAAIGPPESQLVSAALDAYPETEHALRLELRAIAFAAGHRELVNSRIGNLDEPHLVLAARQHHIDGALETLTAETHRAVFLAAVTDEAMHPAARAQAMIELVSVGDDDGGKLPRDVRTALVTASRAKDCSVAAAAARVLVQHGEKKFGPLRPRSRTAPPMMRAMCVLASFEQLQEADEPSYLLGYVPARGLELVRIAYDQYNDLDTDGDGDPHTERTATVVPKNEVVLPEIEDLARAFHHCTGTTCRSEDREFRFTFKPGAGRELMLAKLEVAELPPCQPATK